MGIDYYYTPGSAPCRTVLMAAKASGVDLNLKVVDLMKGEHLTPEYLKINPQHTVPCLVDGGLTLTESRAIATYLASQYAKDDSLYPKDPKKRAVVDQRLYFDMGTLYLRFGEVYYPMIFGGVTQIDQEKLKKLDEAYTLLDNVLSKTQYVACDHLTVADLSIVASVTTAQACDYDISKYANVAKWLAKCKTTIPSYEETNGEGVQKFKGLWDSRKK